MKLLSHLCSALQSYAASTLTYPSPYVAPAMAAQQEQLRQFWLGQMQEIHQVGTDPAEFKNHQLPLARIKKVGCHVHSRLYLAIQFHVSILQSSSLVQAIAKQGSVSTAGRQTMLTINEAVI